MWVGWVTPDFHQYDQGFDLSKVRNVTVTVGDDRGNIHDRSVPSGFTQSRRRLNVDDPTTIIMRLLALYSMKHSNCYMVWGGDLVSNQQTRFSQEDMVVGCLVDLVTGLMTFTANGKEINTFYQVGRRQMIGCSDCW